MLIRFIDVEVVHEDVDINCYYYVIVQNHLDCDVHDDHEVD